MFEMPPDAAELLQHYLAAASESDMRMLFRHLSGVANVEISPHLVSGIAVDLRRFLSDAATREQNISHAFGQLTDREIEVLEALAAGCSNLQAAELLEISERTVRNHIENIGKKLGVHSLEDKKSTVRKIIHHVYFGGFMRDTGVSAD
ncbi:MULTISPECIES: LuxR C-terminal-related transcriptional regulator [Chromobacterium]|uniref:LuxR C-terminal-related transcriptional regulator n=1 Tax=Chromobacterium TaxID=535 RepID=UPI001887CC73|nr:MULTISPECIES: LuxR C-terminal-related transcriptional regulator [Chromobacterium]QOZ83187.1 DNA-binding response regulator [Chromobacterium sp. Rain0013]WON83286.1 LuxR C-terminal-related transcriptional regulator [Chromobacterium haemolyticum]